jgi:hypothetical protein
MPQGIVDLFPATLEPPPLSAFKTALMARKIVITFFA